MSSKVIDKNTKIALIGGHMTPALAVLDELKERGFFNIIWIGQKYSQTGDLNYSSEYRLVSKKGIKFIDLQSGKLWRKWTKQTWKKGVLNLLLIPGGFLQSTYILIKYNPKVIVGFGGYLNVPLFLQLPLIKLQKIKTYLHEQTVSPGLASKIIYRLTDKLFLSWEESSNHFPNHKNIVITGNPIEKEFLFSEVTEKLFDNNYPILLVLGGNQGANTFNRRLTRPYLEKYLEKCNIIHQTGRSTVTHDYQTALNQRESLPNELKDRYLVYDFISPEKLNNMYNQSSLILSRSGANTIQKILFKQIPSVLMPLPWSSNNEQLKNAQIVEKTGLARIFEFKEGLTAEELYQEIMNALKQTDSTKSFNNKYSWSQSKAKAKQIVRLDAAQLMVNEILQDLES